MNIDNYFVPRRPKQYAQIYFGLQMAPTIYNIYILGI